jgi:hypothetical protein
MKLYLNDSQRNYLLEILSASKSNAVNGNDQELAAAFAELHDKVSPTNALYVNLKRGQAESIKEFLQINIDALDKAVAHLNKDTERSKEEVEDLQNRCISVKDQIQEVLTQIEEKIKNNPA